MFGIFKKKKELTPEQVLEHLGAFAGSIADAAAETTDLNIAMRGAGTISAIISEANEKFGFQVQPDAIFSSFMLAVKAYDISKMSEMMSAMADALGKVKAVDNKGALIYYWIHGD